MPRAKKGSRFEREICKLLSRWWTRGKRDDIFWRCSQSGGRATQRSKKGMRTYGSYGDIAAVDPIGEPLLKLFTIELKRGNTYKSPGDLLDFQASNHCHKFVKCLQQTIRSAEQAGSHGWILIGRRDHRKAMVYIDRNTASALDKCASFMGRPNVARFDLMCGGKRIRFVALSLSSFLSRVQPEQIINCLNTLPTK